MSGPLAIPALAFVSFRHGETRWVLKLVAFKRQLRAYHAPQLVGSLDLRYHR